MERQKKSVQLQEMMTYIIKWHSLFLKYVKKVK